MVFNNLKKINFLKGKAIFIHELGMKSTMPKEQIFYKELDFLNWIEIQSYSSTTVWTVATTVGMQIPNIWIMETFG